MLQRFIKLGAKGAVKRARGLKRGFGWHQKPSVINPRKLNASFKKQKVYGGDRIDLSFTIGEKARERIRKYKPAAKKAAKWVGGATTVLGGTYYGTILATRHDRRRRK